MTLPLAILAAAAGLLATLLLFAAGLFALSVILSFSIAWYEQVDNDPTVAEDRRHLLALRLMVGEFVCLCATLLLRPLGWYPGRIPASPSRRPPVVLLHGLFHNRSCLLPLRWRLQAAGYDRIISVNTPPWRDWDTLIAKIAATVTAALRSSGHTRVFLIGHSMGGILARDYLQLHGGTPQVAACITLAAPHRGSKLAPFAVSRLGRALLPGSALVTRLNDRALPSAVTFTAIWSRHDNIIVPPHHARLDGAENVEVTGMGHTAMLFSRQVAAAVLTALSRGEAGRGQMSADEHGQTVDPGSQSPPATEAP